MAINPAQVYLIAGQSMKTVAGGQLRLSPEIEHHVAVAASGPEAYDMLTGLKPEFKIVGSSTLADHQAAIAMIESALRGGDAGMEVLYSASLAVEAAA